jgi:hypothetical protein
MVSSPASSPWFQTLGTMLSPSQGTTASFEGESCWSLAVPPMKVPWLRVLGSSAVVRRSGDTAACQSPVIQDRQTR